MSAYDKENPDHSLHVTDWWLARSKRPIFSSKLDDDIATTERRYDRSDLRARTNWDLP